MELGFGGIVMLVPYLEEEEMVADISPGGFTQQLCQRKIWKSWVRRNSSCLMRRVSDLLRLESSRRVLENGCIAV